MLISAKPCSAGWVECARTVLLKGIFYGKVVNAWENQAAQAAQGAQGAKQAKQI